MRSVADLDLNSEILIIVGTILMGVIVMWVGFYFIAREKEDNYTAGEYAAFLTAFFGGAVIQVFTTQLNPDTQVLFWWYPIGLFVGFVAYYVLPGQRTLPKLRVLSYEERKKTP
jgi:hypothetical protein